jgi:iron-sulfur cluster repair protein YtfE (RIC family)
MLKNPTIMNSGKALNNLTPEATISQIISSGQNTEKLLKSIGMKPEKYQGQTLRSACRHLRWNEEELLDWIKKYHDESECIKNEPDDPDLGDDIVKWCNWLSGSMQPCIRELLMDIARDLPRVQLVHGNQYTWLKNTGWHFNALKDQLNLYLSLERETLFPLTDELNHQRESILYGKAQSLKRSLEILEGDQPKIVKEMNRIRDFSDGFQHPAGACSTLRIMNKNLAGLTAQVKRYFAIEQEKLFPMISTQLQSS